MSLTKEQIDFLQWKVKGEHPFTKLEIESQDIRDLCDMALRALESPSAIGSTKSAIIIEICRQINGECKGCPPEIQTSEGAGTQGCYAQAEDIYNTVIRNSSMLAAAPAATGAQEAGSDMKEGRWCPDACPITHLSFFMWIEHPEEGYVPTYGGPFDSYTIPKMDEAKSGTPWHEIELSRCRFDHDRGHWVEDEMLSVRVVHEEYLHTLEERAAPQPVASAPEERDKQPYCLVIEWENGNQEFVATDPGDHIFSCGVSV